jgi:hypothetical protein
MDRVKGEPFVAPFRKQLDQSATSQKLLLADFQDLADAGSSLAGTD